MRYVKVSDPVREHYLVVGVGSGEGQNRYMPEKRNTPFS